MQKKRKIKVVPIKSPRLCEKCMHSVEHFILKECADILCGEPCKRFVKKQPYFKISEHYIAYFNENDCMCFYTGDGKEGIPNAKETSL